MVRVPTLIPQSVAAEVRSWWGEPLFDRLWQALLLLAVIGGLYVAPLGTLGAALVGILLSVIFADDVKQFWTDLVNRDFWVWRV